MIILNVSVSLKSISYNGEPLYFSFSIPDGLPKNVNGVNYVETTNPKMFFYSTTEGKRVELEDTTENFAKWVQPFIDLWQAEKDRLEQEEQNAKEELLKFPNRKERALTKIAEDYDEVLERGFVRTSLGFDADITPDSVATLLGTQLNLAYTARMLGKEAEVPKTTFRDFYGLKRELDAVQVERLVCEINGAQNYIRELKYDFKGQVKETYDNDSLNAVIEKCVYSTLDYSNLDEQAKPTVLPFVETKSIKDRIDRW